MPKGKAGTYKPAATSGSKMGPGGKRKKSGSTASGRKRRSKSY